jgi:hypothetical protein
LLLVYESSKTAGPTFSGNNIIEPIVAGELFLNKGTDDVLVTTRENKPGECILAPTYWVNILNIKLGWE